MSSNNPYAFGSSDGYRQTPKKSKKKWWIIGGIIAAIIIIGAVVGGVVGSRSNNGSSSSSSTNNGNVANGNANTGVPSGVTGVNSEALTATGINGGKYLAIETNSEYMLPVYATGVSLSSLLKWKCN
jgi:hypothetical protein